MIVKTTAGAVEGFERDEVMHFRGIPYAAPTGGPNRFRPPRPVEPWSDVRDATKFGLIAPQTQTQVEAMLGAPRWPAGEDCLTVNVWTPAADDRARPVLFWIHGGGFQAGFGSMLWYDGSALARNCDVVVVSCNYRLGPLGFLHLGDVLGEEFATSGNSGVLDQAAALRWVADNIAAFGGDPDQVTIFGESAGAMSVGTLLAMPAAAGLFGGAIAQSGASHNASTPDAAGEVRAEVLAELGLNERDADALLEVPFERLLEAQERLMAKQISRLSNDLGPALLSFQPVIDGDALPRRPVDAVADGSAADVRLIVGTNADEFTMFSLMERQSGGVEDATLDRRVRHLFGDATTDALDLYRSTRPGATNDDIWVAIATDWVFRIPAIRLAEAQSPHQPATWMYRFDFGSTAWGGLLKASHAVDVPFPFDNLDRKGVDMFLGPVDDEARGLAAAVSRSWASFARHGDPNHDGIPAWPAYDADRRATMLLDRQCHVVDDPASAERQLWDGLI